MRMLLSGVLLLFVVGVAFGREFKVENKTPYKIKATVTYTYNGSLMGFREAKDSLIVEPKKTQSMNFSYESVDGEVGVTVKAPDDPGITSCFLSEYTDMNAKLHIRVTKPSKGMNQLECELVDNKN